MSIRLWKVKMNFEDMNDKELMHWYYLAEELRDVKYIKAIKEELSRRNREQ